MMDPQITHREEELLILLVRVAAEDPKSAVTVRGRRIPKSADESPSRREEMAARVCEYRRPGGRGGAALCGRTMPPSQRLDGRRRGGVTGGGQDQ